MSFIYFSEIIINYTILYFFCQLIFLDLIFLKNIIFKILYIIKRNNIQEIIKGSNVFSFPCYLQKKLLQYYELKGDFARAEDILFNLAETGGNDIYEYGINFFNRLLEKANNELSKGNLPRIEVEAGLKEFTSSFKA